MYMYFQSTTHFKYTYIYLNPLCAGGEGGGQVVVSVCVGHM